VQSDSSSNARIANSTVSGRFTHVVAIFAGATVRIEDSTLYGGVYALGPTGGEEPAGSPLPNVSVTNSTIRNFVIGIAMPNGGALTITDSVVRDNTAIGVSLTAVPYLPYRSAVYTLRVRGSTFSGNGSGTAGHGGISMVGADTAVFDFGTAASPGNNTLTGGDPAQMGPALRVAVPAALTVSAVGNTWGVTQGSDGSGRYGGNVVVTSQSAGASGSNFVVIQGGLRLSGSP
jgi:Right handed beta helix region